MRIFYNETTGQAFARERQRLQRAAGFPSKVFSSQPLPGESYANFPLLRSFPAWRVEQYPFLLGEEGERQMAFLRAQNPTLMIPREGVKLVFAQGPEGETLPLDALVEQGLSILRPDDPKILKRASRLLRPYSAWAELSAQDISAQGAFPVTAFDPLNPPFGGASEASWDSLSLAAEEARPFLEQALGMEIRGGRHAVTYMTREGQVKGDLLWWPQEQMPGRAMFAYPEGGMKQELGYAPTGKAAFFGISPQRGHLQGEMDVQTWLMHYRHFVTPDQLKGWVAESNVRWLERLQAGELEESFDWLSQLTAEQIERQEEYAPTAYLMAGGRYNESTQMTIRAGEARESGILNKRSGRLRFPVPGLISLYVASAINSPDPNVRNLPQGYSFADIARATLFLSDRDIGPALKRLGGGDLDDALKIIRGRLAGKPSIFFSRTPTWVGEGWFSLLFNPQALERAGVPNMPYNFDALAAANTKAGIGYRYQEFYPPPRLGSDLAQNIRVWLGQAFEGATVLGTTINVSSAEMMARGQITEQPAPTEQVVDLFAKNIGFVTESGMSGARAVREWSQERALWLTQFPLPLAAQQRLRGSLYGKRYSFTTMPNYELDNLRQWLTGQAIPKPGPVAGHLGWLAQQVNALAQTASPPVEALQQLEGTELGNRLWGAYGSSIRGDYENRRSVDYSRAALAMESAYLALPPEQRPQAVLQAWTRHMREVKGGASILTDKALWVDEMYRNTMQGLIGAGILREPSELVGAESLPDLGHTRAYTLALTGTSEAAAARGGATGAARYGMVRQAAARVVGRGIQIGPLVEQGRPVIDTTTGYLLGFHSGAGIAEGATGTILGASAFEGNLVLSATLSGAPAEGGGISRRAMRRALFNPMAYAREVFMGGGSMEGLSPVMQRTLDLLKPPQAEIERANADALAYREWQSGVRAAREGASGPLTPRSQGYFSMPIPEQRSRDFGDIGPEFQQPMQGRLPYPGFERVVGSGEPRAAPIRVANLELAVKRKRGANFFTKYQAGAAREAGGWYERGAIYMNAGYKWKSEAELAEVYQARGLRDPDQFYARELTSSTLKGVVAHEAGHIVGSSGYGEPLRVDPEFVQEFDRIFGRLHAINQESRRANQLAPRPLLSDMMPVSIRGGNPLGEEFASQYALWKLSPDLSKKVYPEAYALFEKNREIIADRERRFLPSEIELYTGPMSERGSRLNYYMEVVPPARDDKTRRAAENIVGFAREVLAGRENLKDMGPKTRLAVEAAMREMGGGEAASDYNRMAQSSNVSGPVPNRYQGEYQGGGRYGSDEELLEAAKRGEPEAVAALSSQLDSEELPASRWGPRGGGGPARLRRPSRMSDWSWIGQGSFYFKRPARSGAGSGQPAALPAGGGSPAGGGPPEEGGPPTGGGAEEPSQGQPADWGVRLRFPPHLYVGEKIIPAVLGGRSSLISAFAGAGKTESTGAILGNEAVGGFMVVAEPTVDLAKQVRDRLYGHLNEQGEWVEGMNIETFYLPGSPPRGASPERIAEYEQAMGGFYGALGIAFGERGEMNPQAGGRLQVREGQVVWTGPPLAATVTLGKYGAQAAPRSRLARVLGLLSNIGAYKVSFIDEAQALFEDFHYMARYAAQVGKTLGVPSVLASGSLTSEQTAVLQQLFGIQEEDIVRSWQPLAQDIGVRAWPQSDFPIQAANLVAGIRGPALVLAPRAAMVDPTAQRIGGRAIPLYGEMPEARQGPGRAALRNPLTGDQALLTTYGMAARGVNKEELEGMVMGTPYGMPDLVQGLNRLRSRITPETPSPASRYADVLLQPALYERRAQQLAATSAVLQQPGYLASLYNELSQGAYDPNWEIASQQMGSIAQAKLERDRLYRYSGSGAVSYFQEAGLIQLTPIGEGQDAYMGWKFTQSQRDPVSLREVMAQRTVRSKYQVSPITGEHLQVPLSARVSEDFGRAIYEQRVMKGLSQAALGMGTPEGAGAVLREASNIFSQGGGLEGVEKFVNVDLPVRKFVSAVETATERLVQMGRAGQDTTRGFQNMAAAATEAARSLLPSDEARAAAAGALGGMGVGQPPIAQQAYAAAAGAAAGAIGQIPGGGAGGGGAGAGGVPPSWTAYAGGGGGGWGGGGGGWGGGSLWRGRLGRTLYAAYLMQRFAGWTISPIFQQAEAYAAEEALLQPQAFYGQPGPVQLAGAAAFPARQVVAQSQMGAAAYDLAGPFMGIQQALASRPTLARGTLAVQAAAGLAAIGYLGGGMAAGMMGVSAASIMAVTGPIGLGLAGATLAYWGVREAQIAGEAQRNKYTALGLPPVQEEIGGGIEGAGIPAYVYRYPALTPEQEARYREIAPDMVALKNQLVGATGIPLSDSQAAGVFAEVARLTGKPLTKPGTPEWQFAVSAITVASSRGVDPGQYIAQAGQYAAGLGLRPGAAAFEQASRYLTMPVGQQVAYEGAGQYAAGMGYYPGTAQYAQTIQQYAGMGVPQQAQAIERVAVTAQLASQFSMYLGGQAPATQFVRQQGITTPQQAQGLLGLFGIFQTYGRDVGRVSAVQQTMGPGGEPVFQAQTYAQEFAALQRRYGLTRTDLLANMALPLLRSGMDVSGLPTAIDLLGQRFAGRTDYQVGLAQQIMGGDIRAASYAAWYQPQALQGTGYSQAGARWFDPFGNPINETSGRQYLQFGIAQAMGQTPYGVNAGAYRWFGGLINQGGPFGISNAPGYMGAQPRAMLPQTGFQQAQQFLGVSDAGMVNAWMEGGPRGAQQYYNQQSYQLQMASIGVGMAQVAAQERYLWGGGAWTGTPAPGSYWSLEDQMRNLQNRAALRGFTYSLQRMDVGNQFAIRQEGLSLERMTASAEMQRWSRGFEYAGAMQQRGWTREDWQYQDQMRGLQFEWGLEDINEAIRFSSGRDRRKLLRQRARMVEQYGLEGEQVEKGKSRQEQVWAREDERFKKQTQYSEQLISLDKRQYELSKEQRETMYKMEREDLKIRLKEYKEQFKLQEQMLKLSRDHQVESLQLQKSAMGIQAEQAKLQHDLEEVMRRNNQSYEDTAGWWKLIADYGDASIPVLEQMKAMLLSAKAVDPTRPFAVISMLNAINTVSMAKIRALIDLFNLP